MNENVKNLRKADLAVERVHLQICIFQSQGVLKTKSEENKPNLKFNFTLNTCEAALLNNL